MRNDIYARNPGDPNYVPNQIEMDSTIEMFKQQIESCLFTPKTSVMGSTDFGAALDEFLWSFRSSATMIETVVARQIEDYCTLSLMYPFQVTVKFYYGTVRDIAEIDIQINENDRFKVIMG